jgi:hypothetical protein
MGKPTSKVIQTLVMPHNPVRYVVTNTEKVILVTHDYYYAQFIANIIKKLENPKSFYVRIGNKAR